MGGGEAPYHAFRISERLTEIIEADEYGQTPLMYVISGKDRLVLVDTGCATGDLLHFLQVHVNLDKLPILVVNSHSHFDHIGCNYQFADPSGNLSESSLGVALSSFDKEFTSDYLKWCCAKELNFPLKAFTITRWLADGDLISLSDEDPSDHLQVLLLPGHCPDSLALYDPKERRLFVGDIIYRNYPICIFSYGADFDQFVESIDKMIEFVHSFDGFSRQHPITLAAGHVDDALPPQYLLYLASLLKKIKRKEIESVQLTPHVALYNGDNDLSITVNTAPDEPLTRDDLVAGTGVPPNRRTRN